MEQIVCKTCGGSVSRQGNYYVCDFCRSKWVIDTGNDVHAVERANAWMALRDNNFEKAGELFEEIITKDNKNHEAYWGRALALSSVVYVDDYLENKKVPTCNNITEESFLKNKDVQKAISLAPLDIQESYQKQAEQIEKIRIEWLNKASKEPAYDIFISFKDSDREHGIERTKDSIDVQDLYTALVQKGYNVFFSRVSLRDKVSEQYEPYIYNALKTAKVMIVFGEKAEYFNAPWVKNEWNRYKKRLEKGEKHKNSLITVYKNVNPYDIPVALTGGRQAIDYSIPSNYEVLMNHIKRVIDESNQTVHLDKIEIKGGQISKKSSEIKTATIETREIGTGAQAETDIGTDQKLRLVYTYIKSNLWTDAKNFLDEVLFDNPTSAKAQMLTLFIKYQVPTTVNLNLEALFGFVDGFSKEDFAKLNHVLSTADKSLAESILNSIYDYKNISAEKYIDLLKLAIPYNYEKREQKIYSLFIKAISEENFEVFNLLLTTLKNTDVDLYIEHNLAFADAAQDFEYKKICVNNVLSVQEGNVLALRVKLETEISTSDNGAVDTLETLLKYSTDIKTEVKATLAFIIKQQLLPYHGDLILTVLKYYPGNISDLESTLEKAIKNLLSYSLFGTAEKLCSIIMSFNKESAFVYMSLCLCKIKAPSKKDIQKSDIPIKSIPEFTKYLTLISEDESFEALNESKKQEKAIEDRKEKAKEQREKEMKESRKKASKNLFAFCYILAYVLILINFIVHVIEEGDTYDMSDAYGIAFALFMIFIGVSFFISLGLKNNWAINVGLKIFYYGCEEGAWLWLVFLAPLTIPLYIFLPLSIIVAPFCVAFGSKKKSE